MNEVKKRSTPFPPWPVFGEDEIEAVEAVLRSGKVNYWTGVQGREFEKEFAEFHGVKHAMTVANGTLALELALMALGVGPGDDVVVTSRSFIASASCVVACGARPVFADVEMDSHNVSAETIRAALTPATKAVIPVHLMGWPCDMDPIMALAEEHGFAVIEDCAQAHGAKYKGRVVGSIGHINAFSFCQDKILTTGGEGGMVTTNDDDLWDRAWSIRDHGKSYDAVFNREHPPGYRWLHESFGTNFRMTEMQSAIGRVILRKLPVWVETRRAYGERLNDGFGALDGLIVSRAPDTVEHAFYKYYVVVDEDALAPGWDRNRIMQRIGELGIPCYNTYGGPMYRDKAFENAGLMPDRPLPNATLLGDTTLQFLVHPTLTDEDIDDTIRVVTAVMAEAVR